LLHKFQRIHNHLGAASAVLPDTSGRNRVPNVEATFFDEYIRPRLRSVKAGTSLLFLRDEAEALARDMFNGAAASGGRRQLLAGRRHLSWRV
jgi:hypothetical protein